MNKRYSITGFLFVLVVSTPLVYADVAPPPSYDADCTVDKQKAEAEECILVSCSDMPDPVVHCTQTATYVGKGYTSRCRTAAEPGSYNEVEILCGPSTQTTPNDVGLHDAQVNANTIQSDLSDAHVESEKSSANTIQSDLSDAHVESEKNGKTDNGNCSVAGVGRGKTNPSTLILLGLASFALFVRRRE